MQIRYHDEDGGVGLEPRGVPSPLAMTGTKRSRSGRTRAKKGSSNKPITRQKEEAELERITKALSSIPRYANRFQIFRPNRRQKAAIISQNIENATSTDELQHPIFRAVGFSDLPLSSRTLDGLAAANYSHLTPIQKHAIPQALARRDVLAAAPTGSGKTLAFLVPMLEVLWAHKWNTLDGLGALILSPTRELSMQIFEVLRSVARKHTISAGLVIGGKDFEGEREKVGHMNVLVATPGRLLHHMDHVAELDCSNLKVLVLDEADRILDMGFAKTLDAILANLPFDRQTMLFSATQTKNVKALARLSLTEPEYVAVQSRRAIPGKEGKDVDDGPDEENDVTDDGTTAFKSVGTPIGLSQSYALVPAHTKLSVLWSFIKTHLTSKIIVFFSSGKQVRFTYEMFCKLRPGISLLHIHGNMKQLKRTDMYDVFCRTKSAALFATDVASRGLDFPDVEWVIQVDCPDDVGTYIHRVGRTARFKAQGRAILFLNEGKQERFLDRLKAKKLELQRAKINPGRITSIEPKVAATVASNQELKNLAQRAFMFYIKSIYQQGDKEVFDVTELDFEKLAKSFGLSTVPKVSIRPGKATTASRTLKEKSKTVFGYRVRPDMKPAEKEQGKKQSVGKHALIRSDDKVERDSSDEGDILTIRRTHYAVSAENEWGSLKEEDLGGQPEPRKRKRRKLDLLGGLPSANRIVFSEDGKAVRAGDMDHDSPEDEEAEHHTGIQGYAATVSKRLEQTADEDKDREKQRVRAMHAKRKAKEKERNKIIRPNAEAEAMLLTAGGEESGGSSDGSESDSSSSSDGVMDNSEEEYSKERLEDEEKLALQILQSRKRS